MKTPLLLLLLFIFTSCDLIHLIGVKESKNESPEEIEHFLSKKKYNFDQSVQLNDSLFWMRKTDEYIFSELSGIASAIEMRIFDSLGNYYTSYSTCQGDFNQKGYLPGLPIPKNDQADYINQTLSLDKELIIMDITDSKKDEIRLDATNYQYTIVVYYTIWTNHFSERVLKKVSQLKKRNPDDVYVIFSNVARNTETK